MKELMQNATHWQIFPQFLKGECFCQETRAEQCCQFSVAEVCCACRRGSTPTCPGAVSPVLCRPRARRLPLRTACLGALESSVAPLTSASPGPLIRCWEKRSVWRLGRPCGKASLWRMYQ